MKLAIIGTRGIPAKYGGFETFAQELSVRLVKMGVEVDVYCDNTNNKLDKYNGVRLHYISCTKSDNPLKYYRESVRKADKSDCDIILICGAAASIFMFEKILYSKKKYIINTDGVEHKRDKWSYLKQMFIKFTEFLSVKLSDYLIADSKGIKEYLINTYSNVSKKIFQIEYGAYIVDNYDNKYLESYNITKDEYYLVVSRLEPENNIDTILKGYLQSNSTKKLIIIGNILKNEYVDSLLKYQNDKVQFLGGIYDKSKLESIRQGAFAYLHGHSVGGTNPSLLEALGCSNIVIAHDNIYNREVTDNKMFYFRNEVECSNAINQLESFDKEKYESLKKIGQKRISSYYNWDNITNKYYSLFKEII